MTRFRSSTCLPMVGFLLLTLVGAGAAEPVAGPGRTSADAVLGRAERSVLASDDVRTVVRVSVPLEAAPADWSRADNLRWRGLLLEDVDPLTGQPVATEPTAGFQVAVAAGGAPTWRIAALQWHRPPTDASVEVVRLAPPATYRGVSLASFEVRLAPGDGVLAGVIVEVLHGGVPPVGRDDVLARRAAEESIPGSVLNPDIFRRLRLDAMARAADAPKAAVADAFAATGNWIRLEIDEDGLYGVAGVELQGMGLVLADVDPATLRLYRGGGLHLGEDPVEVDADQADRMGLSEVALDVRDGGDGELDPIDRLVFYGVSTDTWLDRLVPGADPTEFYNHPFQAGAVYWLTWQRPGEASPLPGSPRRVTLAAAGATGGQQVATHRARYHGEQDVVDATGFVRDNWVWDGSILASFSRSFTLEGVVAGEAADWNMDVVAFYSSSSYSPEYLTSAWLNTDTAEAVDFSWRYTSQVGAERIRIEGTAPSPRVGVNTVNLRYDNYPATGAFLGFDSFDVRYTATLDKNDYAGELACVLWGADVATPEAQDVVFTLPAAGAYEVWDVSRPDSAVALAGDLQSDGERQLVVGVQREPGVDRHLVLFGAADLRSVAAGARAEVAPLRTTVEAADYIVIHPAEFAAAADQLAALRSGHLPGVASPRAIAVSTEDIYANFSGGQKDWRAIRQFLRWTWLEHGQRLRWVCLLGDATRDPRNHRGHEPGVELVDRVPTQVTTVFPWQVSGLYPLSRYWPYASDEGLVSFDSPWAEDPQGYDAPDVAIGRMPANTADEARRLVEDVTAFVTDPVDGEWRNNVVFCADDLTQGSNNSELAHTLQAEVLANQYVPLSVDMDKVYLVDYPRVGTYKPDARRALLAELDEGSSIFYYVGHGAAELLADEQVFRSDDIAGLTNGGRRFLFAAFSCDVGVFDDYNTQCMAEQFVTATQGGAIASITAAWVSTITQNNNLSNEFFGGVYPGRTVDPQASLGGALTAAKVAMFPSSWNVINARRYNLIGDPALVLPNPADDLGFVAGTADSLLTGRLHTVGLELAAAGVTPGAATTYDFRAQESGLDEWYYSNALGDYYWRRPGGFVFRGNGSLTDEDTVIPFVAPVGMRLGDIGRMRCIVDAGDRQVVAAGRVPVVQVSASSDDVAGPDIRLGFPGGRTRVRPSDPLTAVLRDTSGVNILAGNPANSVLLEFDRSGIYTNVSGNVTFDPGSYSRATLTTALPADLQLGDHTVVMTASDMFGNVGRDTLNFVLEAASVAAMRDVTVFPSPYDPRAGECRLICDLSEPMDLRWDIYTVSGRRVRSVEPPATGPGNPAILRWDGRDGEGDLVANGVYLYVLRGRLAGDAHEYRQTGQLVIMQ